MARRSEQIGNILITWEWDEHRESGSMIAIESAGVMDLNEARQLGALLLAIATVL